MKITFFELMCLWYTGKYPKRVLYGGWEYKLDKHKLDYLHGDKLLSSEFSDDWKLSGFMKEKKIEILDTGELALDKNYGFPSKEEADLWMNSKPVGEEEI